MNVALLISGLTDAIYIGDNNPDELFLLEDSNKKHLNVLFDEDGNNVIFDNLVLLTEDDKTLLDEYNNPLILD
jgi:uncharacterized protein YrzB (UPF0473 family)